MDDSIEFDPSNLSRKHHKTVSVNQSDDSDSIESAEYYKLLQRAFEMMENNSKILCDGVKKSIDKFNLCRIGSKRTRWNNFGKICRQINRDHEHVRLFISAELCTGCVLNADNMLIIMGRFTSSQLESVLCKYINEYITCTSCKGGDTRLVRENRITFKVCDKCTVKTSVKLLKQ